MSTLLKITGSDGEKKRNANDFYPTPDYATEALMNREFFSQKIWEPACGDGAISKVLEERGHTTVSTDLIDYGFGQPNVDFLMEQKLLAPDIITNPPFSLAHEFAEKAIDLGVDKLALLVRLQFLEGVRRGKFFQRHPPSTVWVFSKRLSFNVDGKFKSGGVMAFAWFVFKKDNKKTEVKWIL